ncbi:MAG TPA: hypothetical protein VKX49_26210 [Bryobacteraceae bacterium]|nr:hypothetical protein [Bryobacteraceae bacterium]
MQTRLLDRLGENTANPLYYTAADAVAWLNATQRIFVLMTLCLETTGVMTFTAGTAFYSLLNTFSDLLLPLRIRLASGGGAEVSGAKLSPARLSDLAALDNSWSLSPGPVTRYSLLGFDLLAIYQQPTGTIQADVTYARCPTTMALSMAVPEIPEEFHPVLIDGAIPLMRCREGGQELHKVMPLWDRFLDAAQKLGDYVRARNKEQGYDHLPIELKRFDRSTLLMESARQSNSRQFLL